EAGGELVEVAVEQRGQSRRRVRGITERRVLPPAEQTWSLDVQAHGDNAEVEDASGDVDVVPAIAQRDGIGGEGAGDRRRLDLNRLHFGSGGPSRRGGIAFVEILRAIRPVLQ